MNSQTEKRFRRNVAAVILDERGYVLACQRSDRKGAWQLPQGGVDDGEELAQTLLRELSEEIGTADVEILAQLPDPIRYEWPTELYTRGYHGQEQYYFLVRLHPAAVIDLLKATSKEFDAYEWITVDELLTRIHGFKAKAYTEALTLLTAEFGSLFKRSEISSE